MTTAEQAPARRGLPTSYAGHVFRSRLEARFAVLFDEMGIRWEYEPEGFDLPHGLYVPDFWLPDLRTWFEVKPDWDLLVEYPAWELLHDLCRVTGQAVVAAPGLDPAGHGNPVLVLIRQPQVMHEAAYFAHLPHDDLEPAIAALPDAGPALCRSSLLADAIRKAKAATFERPHRIPAYPLVVR